MSQINKRANWLKILYGNAIFWFLVGLFAQSGADESVGTSVENLYFHGYSSFFLVSAFFVLVAVLLIEKNHDRKLVNIEHKIDVFWLALYTFVRGLGFASGALFISLMVLEQIDSSYGYGALMLIYLLPVSIGAMISRNFIRSHLVNLGVLQELRHVEEGERRFFSKDASPQALFWLILALAFLVVIVAYN